MVTTCGDAERSATRVRRERYRDLVQLVLACVGKALNIGVLCIVQYLRSSFAPPNTGLWLIKNVSPEVLRDSPGRKQELSIRGPGNREQTAS